MLFLQFKFSPILTVFVLLAVLSVSVAQSEPSVLGDAEELLDLAWDKEDSSSAARVLTDFNNQGGNANNLLPLFQGEISDSRLFAIANSIQIAVDSNEGMTSFFAKLFGAIMESDESSALANLVIAGVRSGQGQPEIFGDILDEVVDNENCEFAQDTIDEVQQQARNLGQIRVFLGNLVDDNKGLQSCVKCFDTAPDQDQTCTERKLFGQCTSDWLIDGYFCAKTCGLCTENAALDVREPDTPEPAPKPTPIVVDPEDEPPVKPSTKSESEPEPEPEPVPAPRPIVAEDEDLVPVLEPEIAQEPVEAISLVDDGTALADLPSPLPRPSLVDNPQRETDLAPASLVIPISETPSTTDDDAIRTLVGAAGLPLPSAEESTAEPSEVVTVPTPVKEAEPAVFDPTRPVSIVVTEAEEPVEERVLKPVPVSAIAGDDDEEVTEEPLVEPVTSASGAIPMTTSSTVIEEDEPEVEVEPTPKPIAVVVDDAEDEEPTVVDEDDAPLPELEAQVEAATTQAAASKPTVEVEKPEAEAVAATTTPRSTGRPSLKLSAEEQNEADTIAQTISSGTLGIAVSLLTGLGKEGKTSSIAEGLALALEQSSVEDVAEALSQVFSDALAPTFFDEAVSAALFRGGELAAEAIAKGLVMASIEGEQENVVAMLNSIFNQGGEVSKLIEEAVIVELAGTSCEAMKELLVVAQEVAEEEGLATALLSLLSLDGVKCDGESSIEATITAPERPAEVDEEPELPEEIVEEPPPSEEAIIDTKGADIKEDEPKVEPKAPARARATPTPRATTTVDSELVQELAESEGVLSASAVFVDAINGFEVVDDASGITSAFQASLEEGQTIELLALIVSVYSQLEDKELLGKALGAVAAQGGSEVISILASGLAEVALVDGCEGLGISLAKITNATNIAGVGEDWEAAIIDQGEILTECLGVGVDDCGKSAQEDCCSEEGAGLDECHFCEFDIGCRYEKDPSSIESQGLLVYKDRFFDSVCKCPVVSS